MSSTNDLTLSGAKRSRMGAPCRRSGLLAAFAALLPACAVASEPVKIGIIPGMAEAPFYLAQDKGYFAAEGLDSTLVTFDAAQPVAVAVASGALDFGGAAPTGGLYNLAGQGVIKIIGGGVREVADFHLFGFMASAGAWTNGLKSVRDLPGHSAAVTQVGSGLHYALALLTDKYGVDLKSVRLLPLQSNPNIASALIGGQADAAVLNATISAPLLANGSAKLIAWVGDETPYQATVIFTSTRDADTRHEVVEHFLAAYRKATHAFMDAYTGPDGKRSERMGAAEMSALMAKDTGLSPQQVAISLSYLDPDARLDEKDIRHQIDWFRAQGMVKGEIDADAVIDARYAMPLP